MGEIRKRPQVIRDLIDLATYIAENNLDKSDRFLHGAEETFKQLGQMPQLGKKCQFNNSRLQNVRQIAVKGFRKYLIFYQITAGEVEIIRVLHGSRDIETILGDSQESM
jgi:toxin ParE1/3/4